MPLLPVARDLGDRCDSTASRDRHVENRPLRPPAENKGTQTARLPAAPDSLQPDLLHPDPCFSNRADRVLVRFIARGRAGSTGLGPPRKLGAYSSGMSGARGRSRRSTGRRPSGRCSTTAICSKAFTSTSCGCGESGPRRRSRVDPALGHRGADLRSPPSGPLRKRCTGSPSSSRSGPVVPVETDHARRGSRGSTGPRRACPPGGYRRDERDAFARSHATLLSDDGDRVFHPVQLMRRRFLELGGSLNQAASGVCAPVRYRSSSSASVASWPESSISSEPGDARTLEREGQLLHHRQPRCRAEQRSYHAPPGILVLSRPPCRSAGQRYGAVEGATGGPAVGSTDGFTASGRRVPRGREPGLCR